jgi:hypothetical protein
VHLHEGLPLLDPNFLPSSATSTPGPALVSFDLKKTSLTLGSTPLQLAIIQLEILSALVSYPVPMMAPFTWGWM